jgi:lipopolysaccharide export system protein LptA
MSCPRNKIIARLSLLFSVLILVSGLTLAQPASQTAAASHKKKQLQQIIDISSQSLLLDDKEGISEYKGNVLFTQNTLVVKADTITLYHKDKKLVKALITGSPADVQHQPDNEAAVHSQANQMEYYVDENQLVLIGNAFVTQGERHFSGEHIVYDTRQKTINAGAILSNPSEKNSQNSQPNERVHVIIGPTTNETDKTVNE